MDRIDKLLAELSNMPADASLDEIERSVWARRASDRQRHEIASRPGALAVVAAAAIGLGVIGAGAGPELVQARPTLSPFGPSSALVPSTLLTGRH